MSDHSALPGAEAISRAAHLREIGLQGMVTLKADMDASAVARAVRAATGLALPEPRGIVSSDMQSVAWMAPDELLILCAHDTADALVTDLGEALKDQPHLAVNVSDARAVFALDGPGAREVLAKLAPVDLHPDSFRPGEMRRTRLAQAAAAFWMPEEHSFRVICFRSVARYVFDLLALSAKDGGRVGYF
ncbi:sarcosine oxidase subunit gamma [Rhodophyticola sp. CCM32]|uniref:sarcosine oxidase subunit gamma n=1 Tax=Rhodophyticola sp. CCM32 TaxID=2916397 RepID=UPI00107F4C69|nr:sarcosine oxidase subunit gamma family protein [Rhodophyticola sp. CCM32]QBY00252.1 sarcosine oxidase subunit gamma [Rhodophyticola sp. CCM32]